MGSYRSPALLLALSVLHHVPVEEQKVYSSVGAERLGGFVCLDAGLTDVSVPADSDGALGLQPFKTAAAH